jgi:hypothetical protein
VPGYEVLEELGRGGMGVVYKARQMGLNRLVALKVLLAGAHSGPGELARFRREAEAMARLHHPNIVPIYEVGEHAGLTYFAMELCEGGGLAQRLAGRPLPPREAAKLTATLARAVHAAHEAEVIHRDLKPGNILLQIADCRLQTENQQAAASGRSAILNLQSTIPKIADFGLAKKLDASTGLTASGVILGTPSYMAPEQASGQAREVGPAADVYALGAILYECLTGRPPFKAADPLATLAQVVADPPVPPSRLRAQVPSALEAICLTCLEKQPQRRYHSADDLAYALDRFLAGDLQAGEALRKASPRKPPKFPWVRLRPTLVLYGFTVLGFVAARLGSIFVLLFVLGIWAAIIGTVLGLIVIIDWGRALMIAAERAGRRVLTLAFHPNGHTLATGDAGGSLRLVDLDSEKVRLLKESGYDAAVRALAFRNGKDGAEVAALDAMGVVWRWPLQTHKGYRWLETLGRVTTAAFSPDGRWLACAAGDRPDWGQSVLSRWPWLLRLVGRRTQRVWLLDLGAASQPAAPAEDAGTAEQPGNVDETEVRRQVHALIQQIEKPPPTVAMVLSVMYLGMVVSVAVLIVLSWIINESLLSYPWGFFGILVGGLFLGGIALWLSWVWLARQALPQFNRQFPEQTAQRTLALKVLAAYQSRVSPVKNLKAALLVPLEPKPFLPSQAVCLDTDAQFFRALTFAPSAPAFAAMTETGLRLYRLEADGCLTERTLARKEVHPQAVPAFTPDGRTLVVRLRDGSAKAWEVATAEPQDHVSAPANGPVWVYAPDCRSAATLNEDGAASLWDLGTGQELGMLAINAPPEVAVRAPGKAGAREWADLPPVRLVAFSSDGQRVALANDCGDVAWCEVAEVRRQADQLGERKRDAAGRPDK